MQLPLWAVWLRHTDKDAERPWQIWERLPDGRERRLAAFRTQDQARRALVESGGS